MAVVERLVILRYDRTSSFTSVSKARQKLFSKRSRQPPPTRAALVNHVSMAADPFKGASTTMSFSVGMVA